MATAQVNGIDLEYDVLGGPDDPPMLLIKGLGAQLIDWPQEFCAALAARQYAAILASPDRTERLRAVTVPTVVIHGADDPLVDVSGGRATADAIPGAELVVVAGMGHDLPRDAWPRIVDAIDRTARRW
jgi:pimeloyl-ACP methyl ester carboxylesterase